MHGASFALGFNLICRQPTGGTAREPTSIRTPNLFRMKTEAGVSGWCVGGVIDVALDALMRRSVSSPGNRSKPSSNPRVAQTLKLECRDYILNLELPEALE